MKRLRFTAQYSSGSWWINKHPLYPSANGVLDILCRRHANGSQVMFLTVSLQPMVEPHCRLHRPCEGHSFMAYFDGERTSTVGCTLCRNGRIALLGSAEANELWVKVGPVEPE